MLKSDCISVQLSFLCLCKLERDGVTVGSVMKLWGTVLLIQALLPCIMLDNEVINEDR